LLSGAADDMSRHMAERTTVRLPEDLLARAKRKAAAEGRTLTALIEDGLRRVVSGEAKPSKRKRVALPVSKATGGLHLGVDLARGSDYQDREDAEYVERMNRLT
jgi:plasmid stability protein